MTIKEQLTLQKFGELLAAMLAREDQRAKDKAVEDRLRAEVRDADDRWRDETTARLSRVQASVEDVQRDFSEILKERRKDAESLRRQSDEIVGKVRMEAEAVADKLRLETETVAAALNDVTKKTAVILREKEEGEVVKKFLGRTTKIIIAIIAVIIFAVLAYALFEHRDDISGDIFTGLSSMALVVALVISLTKRK